MVGVRFGFGWVLVGALVGAWLGFRFVCGCVLVGGLLGAFLFVGACLDVLVCCCQLLVGFLCVLVML